jgi:serine/threonine-protein kinase
MIAWAADGLHYAHTRVGVDGRPIGIVHRDISPQNLFATFDGGLKVLDFGVAKLANQHTQSGKLKGKLSYMSPEQGRGELIDARSDVFSLGIVLFELLTRTRLFPGVEETQVLAAIAHGRLPDPRERRPDLEPGLVQIIARAMAPAREQRFQSARELQEALEGWLSKKGLVVTTSDVADYLRALFARRIHDRRQLIEAATRAELTPSGVARMQQLAQTATTSAITSKSKAEAVRKRSLVPVVIGGVLGAIIIAGVTVGVLSSRRPAPPPPVPIIVEAQPRPLAKGVLEVQTTPPGASLTVDGKSVGLAPASLDSLEPGEHLIEAALEGHVPASKKVEMPKPGERLMVELMLAPTPVEPPPPPPKEDVKRPVAVRPRAMGKLTLKTVPWTAVSLGGKKLGDTPLVDFPLPAGVHVLKLANPEKNIESTVEIEIQAGQTTLKKLSL